MTTIPRPIFFSLCVLGLIFLNSLIVHLSLMSAHLKTSPLNLVVWGVIYVAIGRGLILRKKAAYIGGIVVSIVQMLAASISWLPPIHKLFELLPGWYMYSVYASAALGMVLLILLLSAGSREKSLQA